jgi:hypothetical protein
VLRQKYYFYDGDISVGYDEYNFSNFKIKNENIIILGGYSSSDSKDYLFLMDYTNSSSIETKKMIYLDEGYWYYNAANYFDGKVNYIILYDRKANKLYVYNLDGQKLGEVNIASDYGTIYPYIIRDHYIYASTNNYLLVFDLQNIQAPELIAQKKYNDYYSSPKFFSLNNNLFVLHDNEIVCYDISNPVAPELKYQQSTLADFGYNTKYIGNLTATKVLFYNSDNNKLFILDFTDDTPRIVWDMTGDFSPNSIRILNESTIVLFDNKASKLEILDLKAYDRDFDTIPDYVDSYPDDDTQWFIDNDSDGLIDLIETSPCDMLYEGSLFDPDFYYLVPPDDVQAEQSYTLEGLWLEGNGDVFDLLNYNGTSATLFVNNWYWDTPYSYSTGVIKPFEGITSYDNNPFNPGDNNSFEEVITYHFSQLPEASVVQSITLVPNSTNVINTVTKFENANEITPQITYTDSFGEEYIVNPDLSRWLHLHADDNPTLIYDLKFAVQELIPDGTDEPSFIISLYKPQDEGDEPLYLGSYVLELNKEDNIPLYLPEGDYYIQINPKNIEWVEFDFSLIPKLTVFNYDVENVKTVETTVIVPKQGRYQLALYANQKVKSANLYKRGIIDAEHSVISIQPEQFSYLNDFILDAGMYKLVTEYEGEATGNIKLIAKPMDYDTEEESNNNIFNLNQLSHNKVSGVLSPDDIDYFAIEMSGTVTVDLTFDGLVSGDKIKFKLYSPTGALFKSKPYYAEEGTSEGKMSVDLAISDSGIYPFSIELIRTANSTSSVSYFATLNDGAKGIKKTSNTLELTTPFLSQITSGNVIVYQGNDEVKEESIGNAIILAGVSDDQADPLFESFQKLTEKAYQTFLFRGFSDKNIYYIDAVQEHDIDKDGIDDSIVDATSLSTDTLINAINLAKSENTSQPLYIFLAAHGGIGVMKLGKDSILYASKLKETIADFITTTKRPVYLILEACHSGSFKDYFADLENVVLIYSSESNELSFLDPETGASFTYFLLQNILGGHTIAEGIENAKQGLENIKPPQMYQTPGYLTSNEAYLDNLVGMRIATASMETVKIVDYSGKDSEEVVDISSATPLLSLKLEAGTAIEQIGVFVLPPSITLNDDDFETPDFSPYYIDLKYNEDVYDPAYVGQPDVSLNGEYKLVYVVKDVDGNIISAMGTMMVQGGEDYETPEDDGGSSTDIENATNQNEATVVFALYKGWNLMNIPLQPENNDVNVLLSELEYVSAWKWENNNWAVLLKDADTQAYAASKGFAILSTLNAGEGFWLNMQEDATLHITGTEASNSDISFVQGWNLVGLKVNEEKSIEDVVPDGAISAWKWENNNWAVWLPDQETLQEYAASKGFTILQFIKPEQGFWVNVK